MVLAVRHPARLVVVHEVAAPHLPAPAEVVAAPAVDPEPPSGLLERANRLWPARRATGTTWNFWNARSAWNYLELFGTPEGLLELREAHILTLKGVNFVNFVNFL